VTLAFLLGQAVGEGKGLSSMWRIELLHPATVHAPIVLTFVGATLWMLGLLGRRWKRLETFALPATVLLVLAAVTAGLAVLTGFWADEVVGRSLYDPRPLKDHENLAETVTWILTAVAAVELARWIPRVKGKGRVVATAAVGAGLLAVCGLMAWTAHLGASLVYQQGAGVVMPGPNP